MAFVKQYSVNSWRKPASKAALVNVLAVSLSACGLNDEDEEILVSDVSEAPTVSSVTAPDPQPTPENTSSAPVRHSLEIASVSDATAIQAAQVDTLDAVFKINASVDLSQLETLETINIGLNADGTATASDGRIDFDEIISDIITVNIHASAKDVELDFADGTNAVLDINFAADAPTKIGNAEYGTNVSKQDLILINVGDLTITNASDQPAAIRGNIVLDEATTTLTIQTTTKGGDLDFGHYSPQPGPTPGRVYNAENLEHLSVIAKNGDIDALATTVDISTPMNIAAALPFLRDPFSLQNITLEAYNANLHIAAIGQPGAAGINLPTIDELETFTIKVDPGSTLVSGGVTAFETISDVYIQSGGGRNFNPDGLAFKAGIPYFDVPLVNTYIFRIDTDYVSNITIDTSNGGSVFLGEQDYEARDQTYLGSGDIYYGAGTNGGSVQTAAVNADDHTGQRVFFDGERDDVFFGSTKDDEIYFFSLGNDTYYDSAGDDIVVTDDFAATGRGYGGSLTIIDGNAGSDDIYNLDSFFALRFDYNAGSGSDQVNLGFFTTSLDFGNWLSGTTHIEGFIGGLHTLSFDGVPNVSTNSVNAGPVNGVSYTGFNDNSVYIIQDGDAAVGSRTISSYEQLSDVAAYLSAFTGNNSDAEDDAVFVVNNGTTSANAGDENEFYVYLYNSDGSELGIQSSELTLIATGNTAFGGGVTAFDIA